MQRMPARLLATFLFTDEPTLTAGQLTEELQVSAGSVSGALKMLTTVGLVEQAPAPGSRRDHYRMRDDAWATLFSHQNAVVRTILQAAEEGIAATTDDGPARRRLTQMRDFYEFVLAEIPALVERWKRESGTTHT
ncbi:MarR family transcriptional regulator [Saccharopolyspora erythraea]|nr:MarR family transcriptional regulator [Saccharopolyspora erythraea]